MKMKPPYERPVAVIMANARWAIACPKCGKTKEVGYLDLYEEYGCADCQVDGFPIEKLQDALLKLMVKAPANISLGERKGHLFTKKSLPAKLFPDRHYDPRFVVLALQLLSISGYIASLEMTLEYDKVWCRATLYKTVELITKD